MSDEQLLIGALVSLAGYIAKQWREITDLRIKLSAYESATLPLIEKVEEMIELAETGSPVVSSLRRPRGPRQAVRKRRQA